uniref:baseplate multidomain protein megatron n=1 Tax=Oryzibacter oryziterrae TaxID=2766474 RepID=UPI001F431F6F
AAGSALGGVFGTTAAIIGQAAGAVVGGLVDNALFGDHSAREIGRLASLEVQSSDEGSPIPRVYGRMRLAGEVIWATRFEETATTESAGGKGQGPKVTTYSYFANFAVGICEGPIARIGRVWANGELVDLTKVTMRVHLGTEGQAPDSLILAKQGDVPAYRGLAYVVFEQFPLEDFGNALPQLSFEVIRPVGRLESRIKAVTLIPAATEFGYATTKVTQQVSKGITAAENRHAAIAGTDLEASLDELQAVCPNLESVAVVVTWFGDDLRAGSCTIRPKVEIATKTTTGLSWSVSGLTRATAELVSRVDGKAAFGGTPSDQSVVEVIRELKARGLKVTFYPFIMMDVPSGNTLPDPYGGTGQPVYPWRGRITCHPAKGQGGSVWGTATAASQIDGFLGAAMPGDFSVSGTTVSYGGAPDWGYRRMILHYAKLCAAAGGVDTFLIASELRGLTTVRATGRSYPFVSALVTLAGEIKALLGASTKVSYAADWSEWNGHQVDAGDYAFHLDPLWACDDVDFVGIDAYFPLSDWRDGEHQDAALYDGPLDLAYLAGNVAGGEGYDWYYASKADRLAGNRSPITDGLGKPWLYRTKDIEGWWNNRHYDRIGGVEQASPSGWLAGLKPIRFTEIGCPAADYGGNEPNVFPDKLSSEGKAPWFSHGRRDDAAQRLYLEALIGHFDPDADGFVSGNNPTSSRDGRRMVDIDRAHIWTWDARPFPWFPLATEVWADGGNWQTGHWLNGRLGAAPLREVAESLAASAGLAGLDASGVTAVVDGLVIADRSSVRATLEPLAEVFGFDLVETATGARLANRGGRVRAELTLDDLVSADRSPDLETRRAQDADIPGEIAVAFLDAECDGQRSSVAARVGGRSRTEDIAVPVIAAAAVMQGAAERLMREREAGRESFVFRLSARQTALEPGDVVRLDTGGRIATLAITAIEDGDSRKIEARGIDLRLDRRAANLPPSSRMPGLVQAVAAPVALVLDLPGRYTDSDPYRPWVAAASTPWPGRMTVHQESGGSYVPVVTLTRPAVIGSLNASLGAGRVWHFDEANDLDVTLVRGTLASRSESALLAGANLAAVGSMAGGWEVIQFRDASLIAERRYRLSGLLRGQGGTERFAASGHASGSDFVLLDKAVQSLPIVRTQVGRELTLRIGDAKAGIGDPELVQIAMTPAGVGLTPYAPVRLSAVRDPTSGDVTIRWIRRTRTGGDDFDGYEVALGEASEAYEIKVYDGATVKRTLNASSPSLVYSAAAQTSDFGSPPATLDLSVAQISETMGPGWPLRSTLHV